MGSPSPVSRAAQPDERDMQRAQARVCMYVPSPGKTDARVVREARALADAGYRVSVVDIEHNPHLPTVETVDGITFSHVLLPVSAARHYSPRSTLPWLTFKVRRMLAAACRLLVTSADVYHAHDITALPPTYLAAAVRRRPLVFDAHELPMVQAHLRGRRILRTASVGILRFFVRRCTATITVSPPLVDEMHQMLGGPRAEVIRNIPDYARLDSGDRIRRALALQPETRIALYQGVFETNRSLDVLVRTSLYLDPNIVIVLLGKGRLQRDIERQIDELGAGERVKILPFVPNDELLSWTCSADLGLMVFSPEVSISTRYCLPNKFFEYIMAGLPILSTQLDAVVEEVKRYNLGCVIPDLDPERVGRAISAMLRDGAALREYRANALTAAETTFRWDVERAKLVNLYTTLTAARDGRDRGGLQHAGSVG